jgi:hypothetical protein
MTAWKGERQLAAVQRVAVPGVEEVLHQVDGREDGLATFELAYSRLDHALAFEHRDAGGAVGAGA